MSENTEDTRVTRVEAARIAGVDVRTISRWKAEGLITDVQYATDFRSPATYSLKEVMKVAVEMGHVHWVDAERLLQRMRLPEAE